MRPTVNFRFRGQQWTLYKRKPASSQTPWTFGPVIAGKRFSYATGTPDRQLAEGLAKKFLETSFNGALETIKPGNRQRVPTLGECVARYLKQPGVRESTARRNCACLYRMVRSVSGIDDPSGASLSILTRESAETWLAKCQGLPQVDYGRVTARNYSANSVLLQARSLFGKRRHDLWKGLRMPEGVGEFVKTRLLNQPSTMYAPLPSECLTAMDAAAIDLQKTDFELWVCHKMIRLMGLRDNEVLAARTDWLARMPAGLVLRIIARPDQYIPKGREGSVVVPDALTPWFEHLMGKATEVGRPLFLVADAESPVPTRRQIIVYRTHPKWLRQFLPADRKKPAHELRKEAGSLVARKFRSWEAAARFLREDLETAKRHYLELLEPVGLQEIDVTR